MRTYQQTHPWLEFRLDTGRLDYTTWMLLGEAVSKAEHIAGVPLPPVTASRLHALYLAKGALASTAIEGNTLTEDEVVRHLEGRLTLPPSRQYLAREVDNVVEACNSIGQKIISTGSSPVTVDDIKSYNRMVLDGLSLDEDVVPGEFRLHRVRVGRYSAVPPEDCEYLLTEFCNWLGSLVPPDGFEMAFSILIAIIAHLYFVWIHPFGDGNGRTARLLEFRYLLQAGFPTPTAHLLSNHYNRTRTEYYRMLDKAGSSGGKTEEFVAYAVKGLVDQLSEQLDQIRALQMEITWRDYVHEQFRKGSQSRDRQKMLVLALSGRTEDDGWVDAAFIAGLSAETARAYSVRTDKTLARDLNSLQAMNLIERENGRIRANRRLILAFLPAGRV